MSLISNKFKTVHSNENGLTDHYTLEIIYLKPFSSLIIKLRHWDRLYFRTTLFNIDKLNLHRQTAVLKRTRVVKLDVSMRLNGTIAHNYKINSPLSALLSCNAENDDVLSSLSRRKRSRDSDRER